jgi:hypothetical protein
MPTLAIGEILLGEILLGKDWQALDCLAVGFYT